MRMACHPRGHRDQAAPEQLVLDVELLVSGLDPVLVGDDPHLDETDRVVVHWLAVYLPGVVLLRVQDPGSRAHPLG